MAIFETFSDLIPGFKFTVDIPGFGSINFAECTNIGFTNKTQEYQGGGDYRVKELYLGTKYNDVTLRRGMSNSKQLWEFANHAPKSLSEIGNYVEYSGGPKLKEFRTDISIKQLDNAGIVVKKWVLKDAWVKSYNISSLDASKSEIAFETVVLACSGISLEDASLFDTILTL